MVYNLLMNLWIIWIYFIVQSTLMIVLRSFFIHVKVVTRNHLHRVHLLTARPSALICFVSWSLNSKWRHPTGQPFCLDFVASSPPCSAVNLLLWLIVVWFRPFSLSWLCLLSVKPKVLVVSFHYYNVFIQPIVNCCLLLCYRKGWLLLYI